jgi:hypothetical protein
MLIELPKCKYPIALKHSPGLKFPNRAMPITLHAEEVRPKERTDIEEASDTRPYTLRANPRMNDRTLVEDPKCAKSSADSVLPSFAIPYKDSELPR